MMAEFWWKSAVVAVLLSGLNNQINLVRAGKCDLEKTFRTPRDMSNVNFDHFEIVERDGYDADPTTTTTEAPQATENESKKNGNTIAKAQVHLRFGGDDIYGSNHIMKIPPQCRNVAGHALPHYPNPYYPPQYPSYSYYHPYPPPVPYMFPNYYFCNYAQESQNLPRPLKEYFRTHGQFSGEDAVFIKGRPAGEDYTDFVDVNRQSKNLLSTNLADDTKLKHVAAALFIRPRNLELLDQIDEDLEEMITENTKIGALAAEKEAGNRKNATIEHNHIMDDFSEKLKKHHKHHEKKYKKNENDELKDWLRKALLTYEKFPNFTEVSDTNEQCKLDPILPLDSLRCNKKLEKLSLDMDKLEDTEDLEKDCKCLQCQCHKKDKNKKFNDNMDDMDIVVAEIIDPYDELLKTSQKDQKSLIYNLAKIGLELADDDSFGLHQVPPKISLDLELVDSDNADPRSAGSSSIKSASANSYRYPQPKISNCGHSISSGCRHTSNPCTTTYYQTPTNVDTLEVDGADLSYNRYNIPGSCYGARNPSTSYCGCSSSDSSPSVFHNYHRASPSNCYFFPEPNVYIKKQPEPPHLPKLLEILPRPNLSPNNAPCFCTKCGHKHSGNNYCDNCGHPVGFYSTSSGYSCPTCPIENKQLNYW